MFSLLFSKYNTPEDIRMSFSVENHTRISHVSLPAKSSDSTHRQGSGKLVLSNTSRLSRIRHIDRMTRLGAAIKTCKSSTLSLTSITPLPDEYQKSNLGDFMLFLLFSKFSPEQP
jgi:hypothetical protein